jgi:hypothetical protein
LKLKVIDYTCRTRGLKTYPSGKRPVNRLRLAATFMFMLLTEVVARMTDPLLCRRTWSSGAPTRKFNLLVGRQLQEAYGQEPQIELTMPLLEGACADVKFELAWDPVVRFRDAVARGCCTAGFHRPRQRRGGLCPPAAQGGSGGSGGIRLANLLKEGAGAAQHLRGEPENRRRRGADRRPAGYRPGGDLPAGARARFPRSARRFARLKLELKP